MLSLLGSSQEIRAGGGCRVALGGEESCTRGLSRL